MTKIIQEPDKILRGIAKEVPLAEISSKATKKTLANMKLALHREPDGVAIAAPQIAEPLRIFIIAGFVFDLKKRDPDAPKSPDKVFINPEITKVSKAKKWIEGEGCLSVRWIYGTAERHQKASITAYDEYGKKFTLHGSGLLAQIFQHEVDHLNGILFIDHAKNIRHMTDAEIADYKEELKRLNH